MCSHTYDQVSDSCTVCGSDAKSATVATPSGVSGCFIAGTEIIMADWSCKSIEEIRTGDRVMGTNGGENIVLSSFYAKLGDRKLYGFNGGRGFVTAGHPFMTEDGWKSVEPEATLEEKAGMEVGKLAAGDILVTKESNVVIETIDEYSTDEQEVYDLQLNGDNTYYANSYLVYNKGNGGS